MDTPFKWEVVLREEGSTLTGIVNSCDTGGLVREILNGRREGNTIRFACRRGNDDGTVSFTGRLDGDEIRFTWDRQPRTATLYPVPGPANELFGYRVSSIPSAPPMFAARRVPDGELAKFTRSTRWSRVRRLGKSHRDRPQGGRTTLSPAEAPPRTCRHRGASVGYTAAWSMTMTRGADLPRRRELRFSVWTCPTSARRPTSARNNGLPTDRVRCSWPSCEPWPPSPGIVS